MSIDIQRISRTFGTFRALDEVSLFVPTGELVALLGPSGSGKTTLLRIIAGLEEPDRGSGRISFDHEDVTERNVADRGVGFVFQHYALFRHLTVRENIAFGLRVRPRRSRPAESAIRSRVDQLLAMVQLDGLALRYPHQLSGGQRQRVALARALAVEPRILLLDEPFGALDARVRLELRRWLRQLHDELHVTSVFVTHDQEEALEVADRVVVMNRGEIEQVGTPSEVFHDPQSRFVVDFLGNVNRLPGTAVAGRASFDGFSVDVGQDGPVELFVRPHELLLLRRPPEGDAIAGTVRRVHAAGPVVRLEVQSGTGLLSVDLAHGDPLKVGDAVWLVPRRTWVFPVSTVG